METGRRGLDDILFLDPWIVGWERYGATKPVRQWR
jgi:hypothetical protein